MESGDFTLSKRVNALSGTALAGAELLLAFDADGCRICRCRDRCDRWQSGGYWEIWNVGFQGLESGNRQYSIVDHPLE